MREPTDINYWLDQTRGGMTDERLTEVFALVKPTDNWKDRIGARVDLDAATADELDRAVIWFTGGAASVEPVYANGEQVAWWVEAAGYYESCGA